jgi:hypothetical protein
MTTTTAAPSEQQGGFGPTRDKKEFPCESCGAPLLFSIGAQRLKCEHCGFEKALELAEDARPVSENDLRLGLQRQAQKRSTTTTATKQECRCNACGGIVVFEGSLTASSCSWCDTPLQLKNAHVSEHPIPVDGIATFRVEKAAAQANLRSWVSSRWFAPGEWTRRGVDGKFDGVYMPFFTFDAMTFTRYRGERGDAYYVETGSGNNKRRERRVRWSAASGAFQRFFDDVCVPALKALPTALLRGLEPWPTEQLTPFSEGALAGKRAHTYERELQECFDLARQRIDEELTRDVRQRIGGDEQRIHDKQTQYSALSYKHVLLPVWILAYRYGDKPYRVVVNAVTGKVHGERPWSVPKIVAAVLAALVLLVILTQAGKR